MKKEDKKVMIDELTEKFKSASSIYLTDFTGINVMKMEKMRIKFRESKSDFRIVKNTLARIALERAGYDAAVGKHFEGPTGIAFGYDDAVAPAKVLSNFLKEKDYEKLKIKVCIIERQEFKGTQIDQLALMPSKKDLLAQLMGLLNSPMQSLVMTLNAPLQNLVGVLESLKEKKAA
jgi:large subunit ribosomal protein L10